MGIPGFFNWLRNDPDIKSAVTRRLPNEDIDIFALDLNGIIHEVTQHTFKYGKYEGEKISINVQITKTKTKTTVTINQNDYNKLIQQVYETVFAEIVGLVKAVAPRKMLIVAIDGVAPQSKIIQQRGRRYNSAADRNPEQVFDSNSVTPGTDFMFGLDEYLTEKLSTAPEEHNFPKIVYSSHMHPGEGEHKIADILRDTDANKMNVMIHGADADLNMIYLTQLENGWNNIYLFRESSVGEYYPQNVIDLKHLSETITNKYDNAENPLDDFIVVMTLIGNDFLPHFPGFENTREAIEVLYNGYQEFLKRNPGIVKNEEINWNTFEDFIFFMESRYENLLLEVTSDTRRIPFIPAEKSKVHKEITILGRKQQIAIDFNKFSDNWYNYALNGQSKDSIVSPEDKNSMVKSYLTGVNWVYIYYKKGVKNVNPQWFYPHHYTPVFIDLFHFMVNHESGVWVEESIQSGFFLNALHQLLMVLPSKSSNSAPAEIAKLYKSNSSIADMFPATFQNDFSGKLRIRKKNEVQILGVGVPLIPFPVVARVLDAVNDLKIPKKKEFVQRFNNKDNLVVNSDTFPVRIQSEQSRGSRGGSSFRGRGGSRGGRGDSKGGSSFRGGGGSRGSRGSRGGSSFRGRGGSRGGRGDSKGGSSFRGGGGSRGSRGSRGDSRGGSSFRGGGGSRGDSRGGSSFRGGESSTKTYTKDA